MAVASRTKVKIEKKTKHSGTGNLINLAKPAKMDKPANVHGERETRRTWRSRRKWTSRRIYMANAKPGEPGAAKPAKMDKPANLHGERETWRTWRSRREWAYRVSLSWIMAKSPAKQTRLQNFAGLKWPFRQYDLM